MTLNWPFIHTRSPVIERAEGVYLYDNQGRSILDAAGGAIVSNVGHGNPRVIEAMRAAAEATSYVVPTWETPSRRALLDALETHWLPPELTRVHITSDGTAAVESAMKLALQYQQAIGQAQRTKIVGRTPSYHGTTLATASISGHPARKLGLEQALPNFPEVPAPYPLRCPLGNDHSEIGRYYVDLFVDVIEQEGSDTIAALLAEPITGSSGGAIVPPDDYWPQMEAVCKEHGILIIMDEVMTGFGRTGEKFGHQHWSVRPDIVVGGKGLAGGYAPLGGVFATETVGSTIQQAQYPVMFNTFGAHPAACAAGAEVLTIMQEENLVQRSVELGEYLHTQLHQRLDRHPHVAEIRGRGLFAGIEIVQNHESLERFPQDAEVSRKIVGHGLSEGVFFYGGGTGTVRDIVCMGPAFTITESELDKVVDTLVNSIDAATASSQ